MFRRIANVISRSKSAVISPRDALRKFLKKQGRKYLITETEFINKPNASAIVEATTAATTAAVKKFVEEINLHESRMVEKAVRAARSNTPVPSITKVLSRQILDSRGIPTVEVDVHTHKGRFQASAPSGSTCKMYELRDDNAGIYFGKGVSGAVKNINDIISEVLIGIDPKLQGQIDQAMIDLDKKNKGILGSNAILAVSMAACKAGAAEKEVSLYQHIADLAGKTTYNLPVPAFTVISGGKHGGNILAIQGIMILPVGAKKFEEALQMGLETYHHLKAVITEKYGQHGCSVGEDGGFTPNISSLQEGLDFVVEAIDRAGYKEKMKIAIDAAAKEFCIGTKYDLDHKSPSKAGQNFKSGEDMLDMYKELCEGYPIVSIEDPFDKEDWEHSKNFSSLGICQVVGDDLQDSTCSAYLLKINQIGTVTKAIEAAKLAKDADWGVVISHVSGEAEGSFIADLSVGLSTGQIKAGAPCRGERVAKYNQLLRIEEELGDHAIYVGDDWRHGS